MLYLAFENDPINRPKAYLFHETLLAEVPVGLSMA